MKITPQQEALLRRVTATRLAHKTKIAGLDAEIQALKERYARSEYDELCDAVYAAHTAKIPKAKIGDAYGTKDRGTILRIISDRVSVAREEVPGTLPDQFKVTKEDDLFTLEVISARNWTDQGDDGTLVEDVTMSFKIEEVSENPQDPKIVLFVENPWAAQNPQCFRVIARQLEAHQDSGHPINEAINERI